MKEPLLYSIQVPMRCRQSVYLSVVQNLEKQTCKQFELIVCDDFCDEPLKPLKPSFPHKLVRITERPTGWGYPVARNACIKHCTRSIPYMVYMDADWMITENSLQAVKQMLGPDRIIQGWKYYIGKGPKKGVTKVYPEFAIIPLDAILLCNGLDEIFFPHYMGYWHDLMRRLQMIKKMQVIQSKALFAVDVGSTVIFDRDRNDGKKVLEKTTSLNNVLSLKNGLFNVSVISETGY